MCVYLYHCRSLTFILSLLLENLNRKNRRICTRHFWGFKFVCVWGLSWSCVGGFYSVPSPTRGMVGVEGQWEHVNVKKKVCVSEQGGNSNSDTTSALPSGEAGTCTDKGNGIVKQRSPTPPLGQPRPVSEERLATLKKHEAETKEQHVCILFNEDICEKGRPMQLSTEVLSDSIDQGGGGATQSVHNYFINNSENT